MDEPIRLQEMLFIVKKRIILLISSVVAALILVFIIHHYFLPPVYEASAQLLINQPSQEQMSVNTNDIQTNLELINTYNVILQSPIILTQVIDTLELNMTTTELHTKIHLMNEQQSQVMKITVRDEKLEEAIKIVNQTAIIFQKEIPKLMHIDNVNILSQASSNDHDQPVSRNYLLHNIIASSLAILLSLTIIFLMEYLDTTIKSEEQLEEIIELPILGVISPIAEKDVKKNIQKQSTQKKRWKVV